MEYSDNENEERYLEYVLWDAFEEMKLAPPEMLEGTYHRLCLKIGNGQPDRDELKFAALTSLPVRNSCALEAPKVWDVDGPEMPWEKSILARIERLKHRSTWRRTSADLPKDRRVGEEEDGARSH